MVEVELQLALYEALGQFGFPVVDRSLQAADAGSGTDYPRIEIGAIAVAPFDTYGERGHDAMCRVHVRDRSASLLRAKTIQGLIYERLHRGELAVTGFHTILVERVSSFCEVTSDNGIHGVCEYRVLMETND